MSRLWSPTMSSDGILVRYDSGDELWKNRNDLKSIDICTATVGEINKTF
jgi:hypothetical protein